MDKISIDFNLLKLNNLTINEYLILYRILFPASEAARMFNYRKSELTELEKKGFIKILPDTGVSVRAKTRDLFHVKEDYFLKWLLAYPIRVNKSSGGSRVLSPAGDETIAGKQLRKKWDKLFKGDPTAQEQALKVLELEVAMRIKSNDLEYMVEAARWLNGGYHEKYSYLLEEGINDSPSGTAVDYEDDWK